MKTKSIAILTMGLANAVYGRHGTDHPSGV